MAQGVQITIPDNFTGYGLESLSVPRHYEEDLDSVMIPYGLIQDRIERMAKDIFTDFGNEPMIAICVLKGGYKFYADLLDKINTINRTQANSSVPIKIDFIRLRSYMNERSTGTIEVLGGDNLDGIKDKNVLVVEDIIDTGKTMEKLLGLMAEHSPRRVRVASLLRKRQPNSNGYIPDYCGFEIPDHFVVGYALDYNEHFRDLNHICVINENGIKKYSV